MRIIIRILVMICIIITLNITICGIIKAMIIAKKRLLIMVQPHDGSSVYLMIIKANKITEQ